MAIFNSYVSLPEGRFLVNKYDYIYIYIYDLNICDRDISIFNHISIYDISPSFGQLAHLNPSRTRLCCLSSRCLTSGANVGPPPDVGHEVSDFSQAILERKDTCHTIYCY